MTRLSSSSALAESTMDDHHRSNNHRSQTLTKPTSLTTSTANTVVSKEESFEEVDVGVWGNFTDNFRQVQSILDQNRVLIQQVNENHQSKIHDNMVKNVALIQEINEHISKVVFLYSDLSSNFSSLVHDKYNNNKGNDVSQPSIDQI